MISICRSWPLSLLANRGVPVLELLACVCCLAVLTSGCELLKEPAVLGPVQQAPPKAVWLFSFGHSASDAAEEPLHLGAFETVFLPSVLAEDAVVIVITVGAAGLSSPRLIGKADFNTSPMDGDNPNRKQIEQTRRLERLLVEVKDGLRDLPYSQVSDPFGGFHGAASMLAQYPKVPKRLVSFGDQLANRPEGCVLAARDLSPDRRNGLIQTCSPVLAMLRDVRVSLPGAGYSIDDPIPTATAQGLEGLLRTYFARAGATLALYGPIALTASADTSSGG